MASMRCLICLLVMHFAVRQSNGCNIFHQAMRGGGCPPAQECCGVVPHVLGNFPCVAISVARKEARNITFRCAFSVTRIRALCLSHLRVSLIRSTSFDSGDATCGCVGKFEIAVVNLTLWW